MCRAEKKEHNMSCRGWGGIDLCLYISFFKNYLTFSLVFPLLFFLKQAMFKVQSKLMYIWTLAAPIVQILTNGCIKDRVFFFFGRRIRDRQERVAVVLRGQMDGQMYGWKDGWIDRWRRWEWHGGGGRKGVEGDRMRKHRPKPFNKG